MQQIDIETAKQSDVQLHELFSEDVLEEMRERTHEFTKLMTYYKCAMMEVETKFNVLSEEFSLQHDRNPINTVKCRIKTPLGIKRKLEKYGCPYTLEAIRTTVFDVAGVRVCCSFLDDVYMLADAFLSQDDVTLIAKKDYIKNPKENGYRSLHLIVGIPIFLANEKQVMPVEIQLRTMAMDFWASLEHQLRYNKDCTLTSDMEAELYHCAEMSADLDERMDRIRDALSY
ncbi:MAG: GTP pyrophosphokinase family protein [Clostridia bacterium]|nr:GTP pyrophosphokinase family protein [Clostridia bacterium]